MDVKRIDAGPDHCVSKAIEAFFRVLIVDADAALDRNGAIGGVAHGADAIGHEIRLGHEAGAETTGLHAV